MGKLLRVSLTPKQSEQPINIKNIPFRIAMNKGSLKIVIDFDEMKCIGEVKRQAKRQ